MWWEGVLCALQHSTTYWHTLVSFGLLRPAWTAWRWLVLWPHLPWECDQHSTMSKASCRCHSYLKAFQGWRLEETYIICIYIYMQKLATEPTGLLALQWWETPSFYGNREGWVGPQRALMNFGGLMFFILILLPPCSGQSKHAQRHWNFLRELPVSDGHGMQFSVQQKGLQ